MSKISDLLRSVAMHDAATLSQQMERCRTLVDQIDAVARATGGYEAQNRWRADSGGPVFDEARPLTAEDVTPDFLARIPERAVIFSGSTPRGAALNAAGCAIWYLLRGISPMAAAKVIDRWWHRLTVASSYHGAPHFIAEILSEGQAAQLPSYLWPVPNFDGSSDDGMALVERLRALQTGNLIDPLRTRSAPVVLEIGAGYGALALALKHGLPHATYIIVDLPDTLKLCGAYLMTRQGAPVLLAPRNADTRANAAIFLCASTAIDLLEGVQIDLAINTLSFGEMAEAEVDRYAAFLRRNFAPGGVLFEQNFDNRHLSREHFCNPESILSRRFRGRSTIAGQYFKGTPRVWSA